MKKLILFSLLFIAIDVLGVDKPAPTCATLNSGLGRYCVFKSSNPWSRDVLYYFHGHLQNELTWIDDTYFTVQIQEYWQKHRLSAPTVVTVSYGLAWLLTEANSSPYSGLFDVFTRVDLPVIEKNLKIRRRILMGESMGGFNAIQMTLKTDLFRKSAILCPPIAKGITPFSAQEEINTFITNSKAWKYYKDSDPKLVPRSVAEMVMLARAFFPTPADWEKASPLLLAQANGGQIKSDIYLTSGLYDRYAAFEGTVELAEIFKSHHASIEWRPQWGGHCSIDIPSLARFLVRH